MEEIDALKSANKVRFQMTALEFVCVLQPNPTNLNVTR